MGRDLAGRLQRAGSLASGRLYADGSWARWWIAALEALGWGARIQRGRTYARAGSVRSLDVRPGRVDARVKGSRPQPYVVRIQVPVFSDEVWGRVIERLAAEARGTAGLLAGEAPAGIEEIFAAAGASLFPRSRDELTFSCSCQEWAEPCKHVAAVHYELGSEFDRDPFLLLRLRGRTREALVAALRARRAGLDTSATPATSGPVHDEHALPTDPERFWALGAQIEQLRFRIEPPRVPEAVLKRLGLPLNGHEGEQLGAELQRLYRVISERAIQAAYEENGES